MTTGFTQPALNPNQVILPPIQMLAPVGAVSDERVHRLAMWALARAGNIEFLKVIPVVLDSTPKTVYNGYGCTVGLAQRACGEADTPGQASSFS